MTIEGRSLSGEKIRERLSYRALDVESIGSVYETVMGFTADRAKERMIALRDEKKLPTFIGLQTLLAQKPNDRQKWLKERSIKLSAKQAKAVKEADADAALIEAFGTLVDERASPKAAPIGPGAPFLQPTEERRRSGSHYTPRSLTEPIVRHALEPTFARIGEKASPEEVLALKVLDPACGSGAFLVEACRQLGARLEQAWNMYGAEKPVIPPDEDEALHARRLVAQKCLYGVDRNPMAVDLARLSLWLATLARDHEFTFLDHALKCGDSLVGLTRAEIAAANWDSSKSGLPMFSDELKKAVSDALQGREAIRNAGDDVLCAAQAARFQRVQDASAPARIVGDAVIAAFFAADKPRAREQERQKVESCITGSNPPNWNKLQIRGLDFCNQQGWRPFHWEIEFPEVFARENPGFDAIVGNPPFLGGRKISGSFGDRYLAWLISRHRGSHGNSDLVGHFFRRAFDLIREGASFGFISTNTIRQGDTRESSLTQIVEAGGRISRCVTRLPWPGEAAVVVSVIHIDRSTDRSPLLDSRSTTRISSYLVEGRTDASPERLAENHRKCFQGYIILGNGFTFDDSAAALGQATPVSRMNELIAQRPNLKERIWPYIGGEEVNNNPKQLNHRFVINFGGLPRRVGAEISWDELGTDERNALIAGGFVEPNYVGETVGDWPELLEIVDNLVKPERLKSKNKDVRKYPWWRYWRPRPELARAAAGLSEVLVTNCGASPHLAFCAMPSGFVFAHSLAVCVLQGRAVFSILQSRVHEVWARFFSSSMKDDLRYAPSDCFETFPFACNWETNDDLEAIGRTYHDYRAKLMVAANEGMTKTYNRFHDCDERSELIRRLRELHDEMDRAVLCAYGWDDLADELRPEFRTEETEDDHTYQGRYFWPAEARDRVLARLLALNAERHAEEVAAGLAPTTRGSRRSEASDDDGQDSLDLE